jgi:hypothetical protein
MQNSGIRNVSGGNFNNLIKITDRDSAKIVSYPWGGYRYVSYQYRYKRHRCQLTTSLNLQGFGIGVTINIGKANAANQDDFRIGQNRIPNPIRWI